MSTDLKNAGSRNTVGESKHQSSHPTETTVFLAAVWGVYFIGAVSSAAALLLVSRSAAAAIPLVLVLIVVSYEQEWDNDENAVLIYD